MGIHPFKLPHLYIWQRQHMGNHTLSTYRHCHGLCHTSNGVPTMLKWFGSDYSATIILSERFVTSQHAPLSSGQLLDDIGYLGATPAVKEILEGTYAYPPEMNHHTRLLLEEAACLFAKTAGDMISIFVTTKDFQDWWLTANENIWSSKSGAHFGHYVVAAHEELLAALHVAKLNLVLQTRVPLERWGNGLTVLLEKEFGSIYIDKLRAICLFEADFNWLSKLIFSKRMISQAMDKGIIPREQIAKAGTDANVGTVLKHLHNDVHRTMHINTMMPSIIQ